MMDSDAGARATITTTFQQHRRRVTLRALAVAVILASPGCALFETGVSISDVKDAPIVEAPAAETADQITASDAEPMVSPADVMFQSTDGPGVVPAARASTVNVFGEVDGIAPASPAQAGSSSGLQQHTFLDEGFDADPCVSPDGKTIVYSSTRHSERPDIYIQRVDGLAVTQLTADEGDDAYPQFSRDGTQVAFASNRAGNWDIFVMDADGNRVRQLTRSAAQELHPTFSPDGTRIAYSALGTRSGQWELWTLDLRTGERRMIGYGLFPDWSPRVDRDVIAFQRARQRGTRWFSAWTLELIDGEAREVTEVAYSGTNAIVAPSWSADGKRLAFSTIADPEAGAAEKGKRAKSPRQDVWTINADGTERARVTDGKGVNAMPTWARDGRLFFVSDRAGAESIWSAATPTPRSFEPSTAMVEPLALPALADTAFPIEPPKAADADHASAHE